MSEVRKLGRYRFRASYKMNDKISLARQLSDFDETWSPRIVGELNGQLVKIAKIQGEFVWHHHDAEDEFFLVLKGRMRIHLRDRVVSLNEGECFIVPRGVEHKPEADDTCHILLFEPATTRNTGNVTNDRTIEPSELKRT